VTYETNISSTNNVKTIEKTSDGFGLIEPSAHESIFQRKRTPHPYIFNRGLDFAKKKPAKAGFSRG
jgi:hypothetical protein